MKLRKIFLIGKFTLITLTGMVALVVAGAIGFWTYQQHRNIKILAANTPNGIHEESYISIGGIEQWIQIRGDDRSNPVLLFVHGGPGASALLGTVGWRSWEKHFTVVLWDQRGAGRTYRKNGSSTAASMTLERMTQDGIEVAQYLGARLQKKKIVLVGHSWGSILGIRMVRQQPELFAAYIGTGQFVNGRQNEELNYAHALAQAKATNNQNAVAALAGIGPPPYQGLKQIMIHRKWADILAQGSGDSAGPQMNALPGFSAVDFFYLFRGMHFSFQHFFNHSGKGIQEIDLPSLGCDFEVPIFFFEGTADQQTPIELAEQYFSVIRSPHKEFVRFEGDHHFVVFNRPNEFLAELLSRVRPFAVDAH